MLSPDWPTQAVQADCNMGLIKTAVYGTTAYALLIDIVDGVDAEKQLYFCHN